ncbi:hypothetical protein IFR05_010804 [Cadophora sp. M221]|nr:hypothetical protein IFR05_010804 [Cadophora sp. M221]
MAAFQRLVRFIDATGQICFGDLRDKVPLSQEDLRGMEVDVFEPGYLPWEEGFKMNTLAGPYDDIEISKEAKNMDYEAELCVIIGKDLKSPSPSEPLGPYILGYSVGNDVSARFWQDPTRSGGQHAFAKSFDKFAPFGPTIASPGTLGDITKLTLTTKVNGELRQKSRLDDLIFSVDQILRHLSMGRTVRAGTVVMTGTPSGVAAFMKPVPQWLIKGDVVEIMLEGVGNIRNTFV